MQTVGRVGGDAERWKQFPITVALLSPNPEQEHAFCNLSGKLGFSDQAEKIDF